MDNYPIAPVSKNNSWTKIIPRTNITFMVISLLLVFGLDLMIIISSPSLMPFWIAMLIVLGVFLVFFFLENFLFRKKFTYTNSAVDGWILLIIILRNIIFVLNFIPFIQLLGLMILGSALTLFYSGYAGYGPLSIFSLITPGLLLAYIILIISRFAATKKAEKAV